MTCYERNPGTPASGTLDVQAGSTVTFGANSPFYHPGPVNVYLAKAPSTAASFNGKGNVWFKIFQDNPTTTASEITWPNYSMRPRLFFNPLCVKSLTPSSRQADSVRYHPLLRRERRVPHPLRADRSALDRRTPALHLVLTDPRLWRLRLCKPAPYVFPRRILHERPRSVRQHLVAHSPELPRSWR